MTQDLVSVDNEARRAIAEDLDVTLIVEAAAGTGKTTELINRLLSVLKSGTARMDQVVAVTFTEKAAGELKLRVREALERERAQADDDAVRERLDLALAKLEEAHVNTIHGFCAELLRERPVEAAVDPLFRVLTEAEADRLYGRAFHAWIQEVLGNPPEGIRRALRRTSAPAFGGGDGDGPIERLRRAGRSLCETRDYRAPWARPTLDRAAVIDHLVTALAQFAAMTEDPISPRDNLYADTDAARRLSRQIALEQSFGQRDLDGWESRLVDLSRDRAFSRPRKGSGYKFGRNANRSDVLAARDALFAALVQFRKDADADLAARLHEEFAEATERYQELKRRAGALDFTDLLARARDLVRDNESVRRHLQEKYARIFVDEFQDTDPIQAEILLLLANDVPGKLFIVGDPKQAIYRFRGTDVGTYWDVSRHLQTRGGRVVQLSTSYRSVPGIQRFVNAAFVHEMTGDPSALQADYVSLNQSRPENDRQPAVVALPVPRPYGRGAQRRLSARAIEESLPDAVGAFIDWMVNESGWQVDGGPVQPRHVALLFRRFSSFGEDVTRRYVDALEARGVPHLLVGGKAFHDREEVECLRAALAAIEWPDDELSVFATLRGSLFAIDDERLLEYRHRFNRPFHPFRIPDELGGNSGRELALSAGPTADLVPIAEALRLLQQLHRGRNYRPVAETIGRLLTETRAHVAFILRPAGEQALANVLHVAELARQYEASGGISFRGFIDELRAAAEATEAAEAPILEEGSDGVRIMTVHKAKGLEFPIVVLADLTCRMNRPDASRFVDAGRGLCAMRIAGWAPQDLYDNEAIEVARDRAEGVRLAYVAATRARDVLVVPAIGDCAWDGGWLAPLDRALYPRLGERREAGPAAGCPPFKSKDSVLERPDGEPADAENVAPGRHAFPAEGGYSVVWWDPRALKLDVRPNYGLRREDLIVKDVPKHVVADGRARYDRWRGARHDARERGSIPTVRTLTVREWVETAAGPIDPTIEDAAARVSIVDLAHANGAPRTGGSSFGVLVHQLLGDVPFGAPRAMLDDIASAAARTIGLSAADASEAAAVAARVLEHDLLVRARACEAAAACRRETPVTFHMADGLVVEGVVDLAFEEGGAWTVVDYKTDREPIGEESGYRRQVALYAAAIARATGQPVSAVILRV